MRSNDLYKMQALANLIVPPHQPVGSDEIHRRYVEAYQQDLRSIFVGNLPLDVTNETLRDLFDRFGRVISANVFQPASVVDGQKRCFGFVEFVLPISAQAALKEMVGPSGCF
jgi:RNA recognition motif-containing protein